MIRIERPQCPDLFRVGQIPETNAEIETKDCILFYSVAENRDSVYRKMGPSGVRIQGSYSAYKDAREFLSQAFHGKCAYCESKIVSIYSGDVEHFRPKSAYNNDSEQDLVKPGYFWLAADWKNLLFACPFCNQTNTHRVMENGLVQKIVLGKLNQFPLETEAHRLNHAHGQSYLTDVDAYRIAFDLEESQRLLVEPCIDKDVETLFAYREDGIIVVGEGLNALNYKRAQTSIRVYALNRLTLTQARKEKIIQIKTQIRRVEIAIQNFNNYMNNSLEEWTWFEGILRDEMTHLRRYMDADQEYAGLARYIINKYFIAANLS